MNRKASVQWQGTVKAGQGKISTESGALDESPYSFGTRFGDETGTNPEELIGAALAACYSMAFAAQLQISKFTPELIQTDVDVEMKQEADKWSVTDIRIEVAAQAGEITAAELQEQAEITKKNCPVAKLLNANIVVEATLLAADQTLNRGKDSDQSNHATH